MLLLPSYEAIDTVFNGVILPITEPYSIAVLVSAFNITSLRSICP